MVSHERLTRGSKYISYILHLGLFQYSQLGIGID
jgi:hypothetical protein